MRRLALAAGVVCALGLSGESVAQLNTARPAANSSGVNVMPGQAVGTPLNFNFNQVGQKTPAAAPQAGQSITANSMMRPYDPNRPLDVFKGTGIDTKNVLAPLTPPATQPDALDKLSEKIKALFVGNNPPPRPPYAPGISRRNRERAKERMWHRD
jgi:hypothetical protein